MKKQIAILFVVLGIEVCVVTIISYFPTYLPSGGIILLITLIVAILSLYLFLRYIIHAKKSILIIILSGIIFIPVQIILLFLFISFSKAASLGYDVSSWQQVVSGILLIGLIISLPIGVSFVYWIFNRNKMDTY